MVLTTATFPRVEEATLATAESTFLFTIVSISVVLQATTSYVLIDEAEGSARYVIEAYDSERKGGFHAPAVLEFA